MTDATDAPQMVLPAPTTSEEHIARAHVLGDAITRLANESRESPRVVLDALLNVYMIASHAYGLRSEAGECLARAGGQILMEDALQMQAAGIDPMSLSPTRH